MQPADTVSARSTSSTGRQLMPSAGSHPGLQPTDCKATQREISRRTVQEPNRLLVEDLQGRRPQGLV